MSDEVHELSQRCGACRDDVHERISLMDRRVLALEILVRGEDGHNGMRAQLKELCVRFDQFEKKAIRVIAVATALPGIVVGVLAVLKFLGKT